MAGTGQPERGLLYAGKSVSTRKKNAGSRSSMALYPTETEGRSARSQTFCHEKSPSSPVLRMSVCTNPVIKTKVSDLVDTCRYSGWVKKRGGKHRNWRRRYLVLTNGCCYYFEKETATLAKGCFSLLGYNVEEAEETDKHRCVLKLVPDVVSERTYLVALAAKHELEAWLRYFAEELNEIRLQGDQDTCDIYSAVSDEDSDEEPEPSNPAAVKKYIDEHLHELVPPSMKGPPVPDRPLETFGERKSSRGPLPSIPPNPTSPNSPRGQQPGSLSLQLQQQQFQPAPPAPVGGNGHLVDSNPTYLTFSKPGTIPAPVPSQKWNQPYPVAPPGPPLSSHGPPSVSPGPPPVSPKPPVMAMPVGDYVEQGLIDGVEDAYYVDREIIEQQLQTKTYEMSREEAKIALQKKFVNGMFLLRTSKHAGTELVITVWNETECKHYKLFQDKEKGFSLTQGAHFENLIDLVNHYKKNNLPKSEFKLSLPFRKMGM